MSAAPARRVDHPATIRDTSLYIGEPEQPRTCGTGDLLLLACLARAGIAWPTRAGRGRAAIPAGAQLAPVKTRILTADEPLAVRDLLLVSEHFAAWYRDGEPDDCLVPTSLRAEAAAMGHAPGGNSLQLAEAAEQRLYRASIRLTEFSPDGHVSAYEFRLLQAHGEPPSEGTATRYVRITQDAAELLRGGVLARLRRETARALVGRSALAARLWMFIEAERMGADWRHYRLFRAAPGVDRPAEDAPIIAEMLAIDHRPRHDVAVAIRRALAIITEQDPGHYELRLEHTRAAGMWTLHVRRHGRARKLPAPPVDNVAGAGTDVARAGTDVARAGTDVARATLRTSTDQPQMGLFSTPAADPLPFFLTVPFSRRSSGVRRLSIRDLKNSTPTTTTIPTRKTPP